MLDNRCALLFIRGERPICDAKYNILKHPNVADTTDGGSPGYQHGVDSHSVASILMELRKMEVEKPDEMEQTHDFQLLSEEELEAYFEMKERTQHEE